MAATSGVASRGDPQTRGLTMRWLASLVLTTSLLIGTLHVGASANDTDTGTVSGTVQRQEAGQTTAFEDVLVTLTLVDASGAEVTSDPDASTTTDGSGAYSLSVAPGDYELTAQPPASSGLSSSSRQVTVTADETTTQDVVFNIVETRVTVTGTISGPDGGVAGASVTFIPGPQDADTDGGSATTAADGSFSVDLLERTFTVVIDASDAPGFPATYRLSASDVVVDADATLDVTLPGSSITIEVVDAVTGERIDTQIEARSRREAGSDAPGPSILGQPSTVASNNVIRRTAAANDTDPSAVNGVLEVFLVDGTATAEATAQDYIAGSIDVPVPSAGTVVLALQPEPEAGETTITGRLIDRDDDGIAGADVLGERGGVLGTTDAAGRFTVTDDATTDGTGRLEFRWATTPPHPTLPDAWSWRSDDIPHGDGDVVDLGNLQIAAVPVPFEIFEPDLNALVPQAVFDAGASTRFPSVTMPLGEGGYTGQATVTQMASRTADGNGRLVLQLFDNRNDLSGTFSTYDLRFEPPPGDSCGFSTYDLRGVDVIFNVIGESTKLVELGADGDAPFCDAGDAPPTRTIEGRVELGSTTGARLFVRFLRVPDGIPTGAEVDSDGTFSVDLEDGDYRLRIQRGSPTDVWPALDILSDNAVVTVDDADPSDPPIDLGTFDVPLDDLTVTALTVDDDPIEGVRVSTVGTVPDVPFTTNDVPFTGTSSYPGSPVTDATGTATLPLLAGTYDIRFTPTDGFETFTLPDVLVADGGSGVQVQLASSTVEDPNDPDPNDPDPNDPQPNDPQPSDPDPNDPDPDDPAADAQDPGPSQPGSGDMPAGPGVPTPVDDEPTDPGTDAPTLPVLDTSEPTLEDDPVMDDGRATSEGADGPGDAASTPTPDQSDPGTIEVTDDRVDAGPSNATLPETGIGVRPSLGILLLLLGGLFLRLTRDRSARRIGSRTSG